jgi:hypothetical protein
LELSTTALSSLVHGQSARLLFGRGQVTEERRGTLALFYVLMPVYLGLTVTPGAKTTPRRLCWLDRWGS